LSWDFSNLAALARVKDDSIVTSIPTNAASQSPLLREWFALAELGSNPEAVAEIDIIQTIALFARVARQKPINWFDVHAALVIVQQLGGILLDNDRHGLPPEEIRRVGAIVHELSKHVGEFIERETCTTLAGASLRAELKS